MSESGLWVTGDAAACQAVNAGVVRVEARARVRYVRLTRRRPHDYYKDRCVVASGLEAWTAGGPITPVAGAMSSVFGGNDWTRVTDRNPATFGHTGDDPAAFIELDLGREVRVDCVRVYNRNDAPELRRMWGCSVDLLGADRAPLAGRLIDSEEDAYRFRFAVTPPGP